MLVKFFKNIICVLILLLLGCKTSNDNKEKAAITLTKDTSIKYAKRFAIASNNNITMLYLFGNKDNFDTTATYIVYADSSAIENIPKNITAVKSPCKNIAALSSIYATMLCELGLIDNIIAIDNIDYYNNAEIISRFNSNQIIELSKGIDIDLEQTIQLNPDIIFTFGMGDPKKDVNPKLLQTKIPVAISLDHKEESPLARAEWIKFFAAFVNKKELADSIFNSVEKKYNELTALASSVENKPSVFNDVKYSDSWFMPGGKSYVANLINDAGANYLWRDDANYGSIPLSFEQVYVKAKEADFWINQSTLKTKTELLSFDKRYSEFKAFKNGNLFNNTKTTNKKGYSTYWETGMIYPDKILSDLIQIFHPELKSEIKNNYYYYEQLN
ncbi:MAG: ABC transporter substrate-binding protein [Bacteroidota bacterium]|nr:ABC transporter substrate-binding protein [Bacteroidota bacterium]MDP3146266.1 ABC transporter substrate-binding protein [Bacteroidota bacterium]